MTPQSKISTGRRSRSMDSRVFWKSWTLPGRNNSLLCATSTSRTAKASSLFIRLPASKHSTTSKACAIRSSESKGRNTCPSFWWGTNAIYTINDK
uniref:Uncharacterized protein n=1 Tax=Steinernema glaseri TaxID=37863 RepID=A0A1I8ADL4_9BILA